MFLTRNPFTRSKTALRWVQSVISSTIGDCSARLCSAVIHHKRRHVFQKSAKELFCFGGERRFFGDFRQCISH